MTRSQKIFLTLLRISLGLLFFYSGISKILDPTWSAAGYLQGAKTFAAFYHWLAGTELLPVIDFLNKWGQTLLGISLIIGSGTRISTLLGAILMLLYYFPVLEFPYIGPHAWVVDEHIIYAAALLILYAFRAGRTYGIGAVCGNWPLCRRYHKLHNWLD